MKKKIKLVMQKMTNTTWKRCLITFAIVFLCIVGFGVVSINYLSDSVMDNHIDTVTTEVIDKINGDNKYNNYFLIITKDNQTFCIEDNSDGNGKKMFDSIQVNKTYEFTIQHPEISDSNQFTHILRVQEQNDTGRN